MMKKMSEGDLVYVPSSVTLYTNDERGIVQKIMKLSKPAHGAPTRRRTSA